MCGINGEIIFNGRDSVDQAVLLAARDTLTHRGPDDAGAWINPAGTIGLGSRRLSIVDLSTAGHMPMSNEDGTIWITYNGEVYNHAKLRTDLEKQGHQYRSHSDTETILHLYEELGDRCVEHLEGMFAFALWDERRQQLLLARDHFGKKPLYYYRDNDRLVFASEIKALLRHPSIARRPDREALYHYLTLSVTPAPSTLFAGIHKLPPAHTLTIDRHGHETRRRYWQPLTGPPLAPAADVTEAGRELLYLLKKSIAARMMADVPFGVFLSGGVDSATNVALMAQLMDRPVDTFSVALADDPTSNEFNWARRVAEHFHCRHHEVTVTQEMFLEFAEQMPYFQDEPLADPVCVPLYYLSKLARDHGVKVVQVGEGSDEIFAGYSGYQDVLRREKLAGQWRRWMPAFATRALTAASRGSSTDFLRRLRDHEQIFWGAAIAFYETEKRALLAPGFADQTRGLSTWSIVEQWYNASTGNFLQQMTSIELHHRLAELLLMRVDKMGMAASVEARVPFLDRQLVEFAMQLPTDWKIHNGVGKYVFREAVRPLLPPGILDRPKQGFCGSVSNMLHPRILNKLLADVRTSPLLNELFRPAALTQLTTPPHTAATSFKLWNLWNLALWHKHWFA
ncbi:MAG: asparagine synthase (glutamine-hydrolyzing) [Verrucomicrobiota bacterium]